MDDAFRKENKDLKTGRMIHVVFDGPPGAQSGRFIEVEDEEGNGLNVGEWMKRKDGYWVLVLNIVKE